MVDASYPPRAGRLTAGIVTFRDGERLRAAVDSLRAQRLPEGTEWEEIRIVVGRNDEPTASIARECAAADPRVVVLYESERRGKSAALAEILDREGGEQFVLLNGDAEAAEGAIAALLHAARALPRRPYGVMARPFPVMDRVDTYTTSVELLWAYHHRFHEILFSSGRTPHLSDELLLLSAAGRPHLPPGIVNDGAFLALSIREASGSLGYASTARVRVAIPRTFIDHLRQRRRILWGHLQVRGEFGESPGTFGLYAIRHPGWAVRVMREEGSSRHHGARATVLLLIGEILASAMAVWDRRVGRRSHVLWTRVSLAPQGP